MRSTHIVLFFLLAAAPSFAQSFIFDDAESYADFSIRTNDNRLICFYKSIGSDHQSSHYRTIAFDSNLDITDTIGYRLPGQCANLATGENEKYIWHIFHTTLAAGETITFLITDKTGNTLATWQKTADDFKHLFGTNFSKLSRLQFNTLKTEGKNANLLLIEPNFLNKDGSLRSRGRWMGLNMMDGAKRWELKRAVTFLSSRACNGRLITFQDNDGSVELHFYDLENGDEEKTIDVNPKNLRRNISVFEINPAEIVIAGTEDESGKRARHTKFFIARFDSSGRKVFDKMDTADHLSGKRMMLLGGALAADGGVLLIGEAYRLDATAAVAGTAASVALSILVGAPNVYVPKVKTIINAVFGARISSSGEAREFHLFPVDNRNGFSEFIKDKNQVYLKYKSTVLWYDLSKPDTAPRTFTTLTPNQEVIAFNGSLISVRRDDVKQEIVIENLSTKTHQ